MKQDYTMFLIQIALGSTVYDVLVTTWLWEFGYKEPFNQSCLHPRLRNNTQVNIASVPFSSCCLDQYLSLQSVHILRVNDISLSIHRTQ
jgi:hypothetical protein